MVARLDPEHGRKLLGFRFPGRDLGGGRVCGRAPRPPDSNAVPDIHANSNTHANSINHASVDHLTQELTYPEE